MRANGILMSVSSLPSRYGIGCFSKEAYEFVDQLKQAGQKYWQILPLGPTGYGDSPYQSFSTFAGNPYFIDPDRLFSYGWLTEEDLLSYPADMGESVDYGALFVYRFPLLRKAYEKSHVETLEEFRKYCKSQEAWLPDYACYMALKDANGGSSWENWEEGLRNREEALLAQKKEELKEEILFYEFLQFEFAREWENLKAYANEQGIRIIGDIPIYVSYDSADVWANRELFQLDEKGYPLAIAGVPPDGFSADGQVWGNPLYDWAYHDASGYEWWLARLGFCYHMYDVVRIDHFRGFDEYFSVPYGENTARNGHWEQGPGMKLFKRVEEAYPGKMIIAEDLGYVTDSVRQLVLDTGYAGMKVLEFAFDSRDSGSAADYLPHNYVKNSVVYTGTHDNETVIGWFQDGLMEAERKQVRTYFNDFSTPDEQIHKTMIRAAISSVSELCVIPMQDILGLGNEARMNQPSTNGKNWKWRLKKGQFDGTCIAELAAVTACYGR